MCDINPRNYPHLCSLLNTELRHVEDSKLTKLSEIVDINQGWEKLFELLTQPQNAEFVTSHSAARLNLPLDVINLIKQQYYCGKSPTLALLNHWSITGRRRPTVETLLKLLHIRELKRAEEYVCKSILGIEVPLRVTLEDSSNTLSIDESFKFKDLSEFSNSPETKYSFQCIYDSTNGFADNFYDPIKGIGSKIGEGSFSSVFRAQTYIEGGDSEETFTVAAKLLKSDCNEKYISNEIDLMRKVKHKNIIELFGLALGETSGKYKGYICLVYPYMQNGSLLDCLSFGIPLANKEFLTWNKRLEISTHIASALSYLHSFEFGPIVHRDVKTANIFIDSNLEPKVGDFTLMRRLSITHGSETIHSQRIVGTSVYMPPEAFRNDISIKFDTFSFGVVLLELITGMRPFIEELGEDLLTYISERLSDIEDEFETSQQDIDDNSRLYLEERRDQFLRDILDKKAGDWDFRSAKILFEIAIRAIESNKKSRPKMCSILLQLKAINSSIISALD